MRIPHPILAVVLGLVFHPLLASAAQATAAAPTRIAIVRLEGKIDDYARDGFRSRFEKAKATGAKVIIIDLDTYGGLVTSGLDISRYLKQQGDVQTIAYVSDKAISAGALIALAANQIVMAPSAQLGDCAPIALREDGGVESLGDAERAKSESPILSEFRDSAHRNGYDPLLVQSMVSVKLAVRWIENDQGQRRFVDEKQFAVLSGQGWKEVQESGVPAPIDSESTLLTVNGQTAVKLGLAKEEQPTLAALVTSRHFDVVATFSPSAGDKFIALLTNPFIRVILMVLLAQCLYAALHVPGHGFPEALGVIVLAILVGVPLMTGHAQWWEIVLILAGIVLLALEIFVIPGFGVAGILGLVCILIGLVMTFVGSDPTPGFPKVDSWWSGLRTGVASVVSAMVASIFVAMWLRRYLPSLPYFRRLILTTVSGDIEHAPLPGAPAVDHGPFWPAVGAFGQSVSELKPGGSVSFYDPTIADVRVISVICATGYIARGSKVVVIDNKDNRILVRAHDEAQAPVNG